MNEEEALMLARGALGDEWDVFAEGRSIKARGVVGIHGAPDVREAADSLANAFGSKVDASRHWCPCPGKVSQHDPKNREPGVIQATDVIRGVPA